MACGRDHHASLAQTHPVLSARLVGMQTRHAVDTWAQFSASYRGLLRSTILCVLLLHDRLKV